MNKICQWFKKELKETGVLLKSIPAWLLTLFVLSVVLMNMLANKSIDTGSLEWLALDTGIIVSWLSFLTMDIIVKRFGPKASIKISILATVINLFVSIIFLIVSKIPGAWGESYIPEGDIVNNALNNTFSGTWYILLGSTIAFIISAIVNSLLNFIIGKMFKKNPDSFVAYAARSYGSTIAAQFIDNFIFALIVSLNFFGWTFIQCLTCALTGAIVELVCEVIFSPIGYRLARRWEADGTGREYLDLINENTNTNDKEV